MATQPLPCTICGLAPSRPLPFAYRYGGARFPGVACNRCGLARLAVRPSDLAALYRASYFEADYRCGHAPHGACEGTGHPVGDPAMLAFIDSLAPSPTRRLLEIGPAGGEFLRGARERGWQVTGVELSADAARAARENFGLDVRTGELAAVAFPAARFDVVYMGDVLEHVPDPCAHLREVRRILSPGGLVVIGGPTTLHSMARRLGMWAYRLAGRVATLDAPPYHLWEFTPATLSRTVEASGFAVCARRADKIPPPAVGRCRRVVDRGWLWPLEMLNVLLTRWTGQWGDRLVLAARMDERPPR